jgi:hypothetical protein
MNIASAATEFFRIVRPLFSIPFSRRARTIRPPKRQQLGSRKLESTRRSTALGDITGVLLNRTARHPAISVCTFGLG